MTNTTVVCPECKESRTLKKWRGSWGNEKLCKKCHCKTLHQKNTGSKHPMSDERLANHIEANHKWRAERGEKQKKWKRSDRSQWSLNVRSRDGYKCALCLTVGRGRQMHAHHIFIASQFPEPEDALSLLNGITLCQPCHWSIHFPNGAK